MAIHAVVANNKDALVALCERYEVKTLMLFGSAVAGNFDEQSSDLDFIVEFDPETLAVDGAERYFGLLLALQDLFARPVDLITAGSVRNPYVLAEIEANKEVLYAA